MESDGRIEIEGHVPCSIEDVTEVIDKALHDDGLCGCNGGAASGS